MNQPSGKGYFASRPPKEAAAAVLSKADMWFNGLDTNGYLDKLRSAWCSYYGAYYTDTSSGHQITFSGEQGELVNLPVNHFRNLARHILVMVTATRPAMEARSTNTDYKSLVQTKLANGLLDYYLREKRLEDYLHRAIEMAIVMGSGYIKMEWNATSGEVYDFNEETQTPIYQGDVQFLNLSPFDVVFDSTKEDPSQHSWVLCRSSKNRYDLIAKYPEFEDDIARIPSKSQKQNFNFASPYADDTDDIFIYEFYHKRTESMPDGRYLLFVENNTVLMDAPMPYRNLPVYRVSPADILGTPFGYSDIFDVMPIQDAMNTLYSAIMTNQTAFAVPNVISPRGADVNPTLLASGLNFLEYNPVPGGGKPEALQLAATPKEVFEFLQILVQTSETISGVNSVSRGNPEASLKSGNALALVQSMSLQFMSGLQQSYVKLIEDVGTGLINMLKDFAAVPRIAAIVGVANRTYMKEFTGDDLSTVNRVMVDVGNPLASTTAGKVQMAEQMLQMGIIKTPEQYIQVMTTGKLETMTDGIDKQLLLIRAENENMVAGDIPNAVATEQHALHIKEHGDVLADPDLKNDPELVQRVLQHIQQHIDLLKTVDPNLLGILGQQAILPPPPPMDAQGNPLPPQQPQAPAGPGPGQPTKEELQAQTLNNPSGVGNNPAQSMGINTPQPASPPAPFENSPTQAKNVNLQG